MSAASWRGEGRLGAILSVGALAALLSVAGWLQIERLTPSLIYSGPAPGRWAVFGALVATTLTTTLAPTAWRSRLLAGASALTYAAVWGETSAPIFAFVALLCALGRARWRLRTRVAVAIGVWAALPMARFWLSRQELWGRAFQGQTWHLVFAWGGLLYSALLFLVDKEVFAADSTLADDVFYFMALPRLAVPFLQPISPRYLREQERARPAPILVARGLGLGAWALALALAVGRVDARMHAGDVSPLLAAPLGYFRFYASMTSQLFLGVALFRLAGFDLAPGFDWPFLSASFAEFFRRFNYYVRWAVLSLFYFPILARLRRTIPRRAAARLAAVGGIVLGGLLLNGVVVPAGASTNLAWGLRHSLAPRHLTMLAVFWSLLLLPSAASGPDVSSGRPKPRTPRALRIVAFNLTFFLVWYTFGWHASTPAMFISP